MDGRATAAAVGLICGLFGLFPDTFAQNPGPQGPEDGPLRRQLWFVPSQDSNVLMRTIVFRPPGPGPFPLVIINHGSVQTAEQRAVLAQPVFTAASEYFVARGYAVALPQRPGHGATGGPYLESFSTQGDCASADYRKSGIVTADSIVAAMRFLTKQPFVKTDGIVVVGQSAGGWGAMALASRNPRNVKAIITFAAGRGGRVHGRPNNNCAPDRLIEAARIFGATARIPLLAIYSENDSFFSSDLSRRIFEAYRAAGGNAEYQLLPSFKDDGHRLLGDRDGLERWTPIVDNFLAAQR